MVGFYFRAVPLTRPFSVLWRGSVYAPDAGPYRFGTSSIDTSTLRIDGREIVVNREPNRYEEGSAELEQGWHAIEVCYRAIHEYSQVYLYWTPPGRTRELIPTVVLRPPGPGGRVREPGDPAPVPGRGS